MKGGLQANHLAAGHQRIERRLLQRDADRAAHLGGLTDDVVTGDPGLPPVGRSSVVSIRTVVVLPAPLGPRKP